MTNLPSIFGNQPQTITTTDGQTTTLQPGQSVLDLLPQSSGGQGPLGRIAVGQPRDTRNPAASNQFFTIQRVRDDATSKYVTEYSAPLGTELTVYPVAIHATRSYMPVYDQNQIDVKPLCASETFLQPDMQYMGKFADQCCALNPNTGTLVPACPMAQWGAKNPATGKSTPPSCSESYIIFAVIPAADESSEPQVVELYFRSASATNGKNLIGRLRALVQQGAPIYSLPLKLTIKPVGQGNTFLGELVNAQVEYTADDHAGMLALVTRAEDAIRYRLDRASRLPGDGNGNGNSNGNTDVHTVSAADAMMGGTVPASAPANTPAKTAANVQGMPAAAAAKIAAGTTTKPNGKNVKPLV